MTTIFITDLPFRGGNARDARGYSETLLPGRRSRRAFTFDNCPGARVAARAPPSLFRDEDRRALFLDEDHDELRRLGLAGVAADDVNVVGAFIVGLARLERDLLLPLELH